MNFLTASTGYWKMAPKTLRINDVWNAVIFPGLAHTVTPFGRSLPLG